MKLMIPPPLWALLFSAISHFNQRFGFPLTGQFVGQQMVGMILGGVGLVSMIWAFIVFLQAKTTINPHTPDKTATLVVTGIYKYTRNPMYVGLALLLTGFWVHEGHLLGLILLPLFVILITEWQIKPEEDALRTKFGESFEAYCRKVNRWV